MNKKKLFSVLLVIVMLMLTACSAKQVEEINTETSDMGTSTSQAEETEISKVQENTEESTEETATTESTSSTITMAHNIKVEMHDAPTTTSKTKDKATTTKNEVSTTKKSNPTTKNTKTTTKPNTTTTKQTTKATPYCLLTIECSAIIKNIDKLKDGHEDYVPSNGYILNNYKVEYTEGDTAYDILKKGCKEKNIKLTTESTIYGTYVAGINNLDEFDCGSQSGWLYSVNSKFPSVSCSKQKVNQNDSIKFEYTCSY